MELPKNVTQIGESDHHCKIYVEDYVISYMKQLNHLAMDKDMAVALYGMRKEENGVSYLFLYGACKLTFLQKETRHLSQAQQQEIEKLRKRYFQNYAFLGYRILNGEMIEGMHVCEQGICRYISGYAQFYEKNDNMLAYMLDVREETPSETVDQEKYIEVKKRQEERRAQLEEGRRPKAAEKSASKAGVQPESHSLRGMRVAVVAVFALLCLVGLSALNSDGAARDLQAAVGKLVDNTLEKRIPDATETMGDAVDTLITEDKLAEAVRQENAAADSPDINNTLPAGSDTEPVSAPGVAVPGANTVVNGQQMQTPETTPAPAEGAVSESGTGSDSAGKPEPSQVPDSTSGTTPGSVPGTTSVPTQETTSPSVPDAAQTPSSAPTQETKPQTYTIKDGDTLIGISIKNYGTDNRVSEICMLNKINDPDDIKSGQKILLP